MGAAKQRWTEAQIQDVRDRTDLADVVGRHTQLKRSGARLVGLCPFHDEKTPSFSVDPSKQLYHCFGCQAGGDVLAFLMKIQNRTFPEVLTDLAKDAGVEHDQRGRTKTRRARPKPRARDEQPIRPDPRSVANLWDGAVRPAEDLDAARWLRLARGIDPDMVELHDVARVLKYDSWVPNWATYWHHLEANPDAKPRPVKWSRSHRLIVRMFDNSGALVSIHARSFHPSCPKGKRSLHPWRKKPKDDHRTFGLRGLVMANGAGRLLLSPKPVADCPFGGGDIWPWDGPPNVLITEGIPDFLTAATAPICGDAQDEAPAVFGIAAGTWSAELAEKIPTGSTVAISTDPDAAGERYFEEIHKTLAGRCTVRRWRADR